MHGREPREPHFREPPYGQWRQVEDELLAALHSQVRHTLASVLNAPDVALPEPVPDTPPAAPGAEEAAAEETAAIVAFYHVRRGALRPFYAGREDEGGSEHEGEQLPAEYCQAGFRVAAACADDAALSQFFQQKLAHLLDVAESRLVRETALRSRAFFAALAQLRSLYGRVAETVDTIKIGRHCLHGVEGAMSQPGVSLAMLVRRMQNLQKAEQSLKELKRQLESDIHTDRLIEEGLFLDALEMLQDESAAGMYLCRENAVKERTARIEELSEKSLVELVLGKHQRTDEEMESALAALCNVLVRTNRLESAWSALRAECVAWVEAGSGERLSGPDGALRQCATMLHRLALASAMLRAVGGADESEERADEDEDTGNEQPVIEAVDARWAKLLRGRSDEHAKLRLDDFVAVFDECAQYERLLVSGRHYKVALNSLGRHFLDQFHRHQCLNLAAVLESERWVVLSVPQEFQAVVNELTGRRDGLEVGVDRALDELAIGGVRFKTVAAALLCVQAIGQYVACAKKLPAFESDIVANLGKLLKLFNSKAALLILGAEAIGGASGIKAISAKHLALSAESIGAVRALLPLLGLGRANGTEGAWEDVCREFDDHQRDLFAKLVSIMHDVATSQAGPGGSAALVAEKTQSLFRILDKVLKREKLELLYDAIANVYSQVLNPAMPDYDRISNLRAACLKDIVPVNGQM